MNTDSDFEDLSDEITNKETDEGTNKEYHDTNIEDVGYASSLRQFYRYKNKIAFKPIETDERKNKEQSQADYQATTIYDTYLSKDPIDIEYYRSHKSIQHSEDPEQEVPPPIHKKKKTSLVDGSSFRQEEFKKYDRWLRCHCISNKTFLGHSQYQILLMFLVFDFVVILGILIFHFRGTAQKLLPIPTSIESKKLTIGNIIINGDMFNKEVDVGITSTTELKFNSSINIGESTISKEHGTKCARFILNGSINIGDIVFNYDNSENKFIIDTKNETLNIAGHLNAGDVFVQNGSQFGGLVFSNDKCINCITDSTRLSARILDDNDQEITNKINIVPKFQYSMANDDLTLIFGDEISFVCSNNDEKPNCKEISTPNLFPVSSDHFIQKQMNQNCTVLHAQEFYQNKILRICQKQDTKKASLLIEDKILYEYSIIPQQAFLIPTFEDGKIIQILTTEDKIHIYKSDSLFNINNEKIHNEEKIIDSNYGCISKLKAFLNDFGDIIVFAQTLKGVLTFRILTSNFSVTPPQLQFPSLIKFDATSRDGDLILIAGASEGGSVSLGRCFDDYCEKIKLVQRKNLNTDKIEFIGISLNNDNKPTISISREGKTIILNCQSFMCEDIKSPVWL